MAETTFRSTGNLNKSCEPSLYAFPHTFLNATPVNFPNLLLCTIISLYIFWAIAVVCEDYLVSAVERLCEKAHIPYDIGGATFLAAATSAPEFFVAAIGTFVTKTDLGIGTILGSSVFNVYVVTGICGIFANSTIVLDWWPVTRENFWYILSIVIMSIVMFDQKVKLYEPIIMLVCFTLNIISLLLDRRLQQYCRGEFVQEEIVEDEEKEAPRGCVDRLWGYPEDKGVLAKTLWVLSRPFSWLFGITIPKPHIFPPGTLLVSILWIGGLCYIVSWTMSVVGYNLKMPDGVTGVTLLALGVSVPDAVASYIVVRQGHGAMAISNAVGSNTFDNQIALGVPWLIAILVWGKDIELHTATMFYITGGLLITAILMQVAFCITRYHLDTVFGYISLISYVVFVVISVFFVLYICFWRKE